MKEKVIIFYTPIEKNSQLQKIGALSYNLELCHKDTKITRKDLEILIIKFIAKYGKMFIITK